MGAPPCPGYYRAPVSAPAMGPVWGGGGWRTRRAVAAGRGEIWRQYRRGSRAGGVVRAEGPATVRVHLHRSRKRLASVLLP